MLASKLSGIGCAGMRSQSQLRLLQLTWYALLVVIHVHHCSMAATAVHALTSRSTMRAVRHTDAWRQPASARAQHL